MVVVVREDATPEQRAEIARILTHADGQTRPHAVPSVGGDVFCVPAAELRMGARAQLAIHPAVKRIVAISTVYQLASRTLYPEKTTITLGDAVIGGPVPVVIAGPCSVEDEAQIRKAAQVARQAGAKLLRGGVFKPRTSPYAFQGLGLDGLEMLVRAGRDNGLPVVTEVMEPALVQTVAEVADVLQIGSRNMQNYPLLRAAGRTRRPVLLKRGYAATIEEWLLAAEYILAEGNPQVILCERGIRSFDPMTRNLLDLTCVPLLNKLTHLPVIIDPSHAAGKRDLVLPMSAAAIAAGADGLIVEMHPRPEEALSDGEQSIDPAALEQLVRQSEAVRAAMRTSGAVSTTGEIELTNAGEDDLPTVTV